MVYMLESERLRVEVNSLGAELWSVYDKRGERHLLWQGESSIWPRRSPTLFPICGKLHGGAIPLHGFIRDYEHTLEEHTRTRLVLRCLPNEHTRAMYPYSFTFDTIYELEGDTLRCAYQIGNLSKEELPFSVGYHSGFFADDSTVLHFEQGEHGDALRSDGDGFLCGRDEDFLSGARELPLNSARFPATILLDAPQSRYIDIVTGGSPVLRLGFEGFPYLALWVKELPVRFVCIEPWHGLPDAQDASGALPGKAGIRMLPAGQSFRCEQTITAL